MSVPNSTAFSAIVGLGYVSVRSPPAAPVGAAPSIATLSAAVRRPSLSTVNVATSLAEP